MNLWKKKKKKATVCQYAVKSKIQQQFPAVLMRNISNAKYEFLTRNFNP